jgi:hypothetical protein
MSMSNPEFQLAGLAALLPTQPSLIGLYRFALAFH